MGLIRVMIGSFLVQHGLVHAALWIPPALTGTLPVTGVWWLLGGSRVDDGRWWVLLLTVVVALLYVGAGVGLICDLEWWRAPTGVGSLLSLLLVGLSVHTWWLAPAVLIDGVLLWALVWAHLRRRVWHSAQRQRRDHGRQVSRVHDRYRGSHLPRP